MGDSTRKNRLARAGPIADLGRHRATGAYPPPSRKRKPRSSLPPEPTDFGDEGQMRRYLAELRRFFHI